jgi:hypothetical protein
MKTGKHKVNVYVKGRAFTVEYNNPTGQFVSPEEFTHGIEEGIALGDAAGLGKINGGYSNNTVVGNFKYEEITTDEEMDQYHASKLLGTFMDGIDAIGSAAESAEMAKKFGDVYAQVRDEKITPEEGAQQINDILTHARNAERAQVQDQFFDVAEKWANKSNVSLAEACHGVAYDTYRLSHPEQPQVMALQEYGNRFDAHYADRIQARSIRAAKDLFGS